MTTAITSLTHHWQIALTKWFGSIIAGVTSIGGGAIAFPVFTKVLQISPHEAKVFSLAIQSVGMGLMVGVIVVYQILYIDVANHLWEYATFKAIGYTHRYFMSVVLQEALILVLMGYLLGYFNSALLYRLAKNATFLPLAMHDPGAIALYLLSNLSYVHCCWGDRLEKTPRSRPSRYFQLNNQY